MDVQEAFRIEEQTGCHIAQAYGQMIKVTVSEAGILPGVTVCGQVFQEIGAPSRCLVISPRSSSNDSRCGFADNKNLPWKAWPEIVNRFVQDGRIDKYVVLLRNHDPAPEVPLCVMRMSLSDATAYVAKACAGGGAYCGVDNGITHIAARLGVPTYCVYPSALALSWVGYERFSHYRMARTNPWQGQCRGDLGSMEQNSRGHGAHCNPMRIVSHGALSGHQGGLSGMNADIYLFELLSSQKLRQQQHE